ncbi:UTRA domain-containing protein [Streptomyces sp. NPDC091368]|uniref:UTRA domain-containing protein n=1 Tax=Streptomyces sp. NPDC091368 TaxID=3365993 RepID=UPI003815AA1D
MAENDRKSQTVDYVTARDRGQPDAWTLEAGQRGTQQLVEVAQVAAPPEIAKSLRLRPADRVVVRRRLILMDGNVIELADSFYPLAVAHGTALAEKRKIKGGAPTLLAELGYQPSHVSEDLEFRAADDFERAALSLPAGASVLTLLRATSTEDGSPYEVQLMVMKAPRRLHYEIEVV